MHEKSKARWHTIYAKPLNSPRQRYSIWNSEFYGLPCQLHTDQRLRVWAYEQDRIVQNYHIQPKEAKGLCGGIPIYPQLVLTDDERTVSVAMDLWVGIGGLGKVCRGTEGCSGLWGVLSSPSSLLLWAASEGCVSSKGVRAEFRKELRWNWFLDWTTSTLPSTYPISPTLRNQSHIYILNRTQNPSIWTWIWNRVAFTMTIVHIVMFSTTPWTFTRNKQLTSLSRIQIRSKRRCSTDSSLFIRSSSSRMFTSKDWETIYFKFEVRKAE